MSALSEIKRFFTDRGLDKQPHDQDLANMNVLEEMLEGYGCKDTGDRKYAKKVLDYLVSTVGVIIVEDIDLFELPDETTIVDSIGDTIVFKCDELVKMGYDPELVLYEVAKEINSRKGSIVNGKFTKDKST